MPPTGSFVFRMTRDSNEANANPVNGRSMSDSERKQGSMKGAARYAGAGMELAAAVSALCLAGYWFDRKFETSPWGLLIGAVIGIVGGLYNLIRPVLKDSLRSMESPHKRNNEPLDRTSDDD